MKIRQLLNLSVICATRNLHFSELGRRFYTHPLSKPHIKIIKKMSEEKKVALVFGASGISGWAVTNDCLSYPSTNTFSRIIALTNRPRSLKECGFPEDDRLEIYSGVNLRGSLEQVLEGMKENISHINEVTHMYYCGTFCIVFSGRVQADEYDQ